MNFDDEMVEAITYIKNLYYKAVQIMPMIQYDEEKGTAKYLLLAVWCDKKKMRENTMDNHLLVLCAIIDRAMSKYNPEIAPYLIKNLLYYLPFIYVKGATLFQLARNFDLINEVHLRKIELDLPGPIKLTKKGEGVKATTIFIGDASEAEAAQIQVHIYNIDSTVIISYDEVFYEEDE